MSNLEQSPQEPISESSSIASTITNLMQGNPIPPNIQKSLLKAVGRLCTSAVEIPIAYFDGVAQEMKAKSDARVKLIERTNEEISQQIRVDKVYADAAVRKFGQKILREQINVDTITELAVNKLQEEKEQGLLSNRAESNEDNANQPAGANEIGSKVINDDWLNAFEKEASQKSTEEMQILFSKILAGEIKKPETFSIKAVRALGELDSATAHLFKRFCSLCITLAFSGTEDNYIHIIDVRLCSLGGNAAGNALQQYGFTFNDLNTLQEHGLIISDYHSWLDYSFSIMRNQQTLVPFLFQNDSWILVSKKPEIDVTTFRINGVALSKIGKELYRIIETDIIDEPYTNALINYFLGQGFEMKKIPDLE